jgi:hypothetical protein
MVHWYKYSVSGHYSSSCLYFKTRRFGDCITSPSPETGISSIDWAQPSRFHPKTETESSLRNVVLWNINSMVNNVQKHNICTKSFLLYMVKVISLPQDTEIARISVTFHIRHVIYMRMYCDGGKRKSNSTFVSIYALSPNKKENVVSGNPTVCMYIFAASAWTIGCIHSYSLFTTLICHGWSPVQYEHSSTKNRGPSNHPPKGFRWKLRW